jgi:hypothetical protein
VALLGVAMPVTLVTGALAGAVGTIAMDRLWYARYRRGGGTDGFADWELSSGTTGFDDAGAPAQVGKHIYEAVLRRPIPDASARLANNVVHWSTGVQWGVGYALVAGRRGRVRWTDGFVLGPVACGAAYALLPAIDVYQPIWEYRPAVLLQDLSAHLVFGVTTATALRVLAGRSGRSRSGRHTT